ncbi:hypothetical protein NCLIV_012990 [Neospora caninum Liverpool]|uniref:Streptococcal surface antigen repeat-containing protein n=1 Tax=Neospora caninum (strain Liverpool) TaxID=572307 RepID=F0VCZ1_NEOCL|nr:hypothetical protein NCLIV_012990 [Neospora caninum Liverpool]CBZ51506.1 hypothetical protein NCLIV_012990 [Neospora caninum Liverpool]CEL65456.1 TPA: streptococcal surface antigen repeat-containing protein [Neospora caninum Liverpool]|eukprot:XP_003881539.1 hypothetical protein NCLIV_012990 [Neospora caninum Liverpool]
MEIPFHPMRAPVRATVTALSSPSLVPPSAYFHPGGSQGHRGPVPPPSGVPDSNAEGTRLTFPTENATYAQLAGSACRGAHDRPRQLRGRSRPASASGEGRGTVLRSAAFPRANSYTPQAPSRTVSQPATQQGASLISKPAVSGNLSRRCVACSGGNQDGLPSDASRRGAATSAVSHRPASVSPERAIASPAPKSVAFWGAVEAGASVCTLPESNVVDVGPAAPSFQHDFTCGIERTMLPHLALPNSDISARAFSPGREKTGQEETAPGRPWEAQEAVRNRGTGAKDHFVSPQKWRVRDEQTTRPRQASVRTASAPWSVSTAGRGTSLASSASDFQTPSQVLLPPPSSPVPSPGTACTTPEEDALRALQRQQQHDLFEALLHSRQARLSAPVPAWTDARFPQPRDEEMRPPGSTFSPEAGPRWEDPGPAASGASRGHELEGEFRKTEGTVYAQTPAMAFDVAADHVVFYQRQAELFRAKYEDAERRCAEKDAALHERELKIQFLQAQVAGLTHQVETLQRPGGAEETSVAEKPQPRHAGAGGEEAEGAVVVSKAFHEAQLALAREETKKLREKIAALQQDVRPARAGPTQQPSAGSPPSLQVDQTPPAKTGTEQRDGEASELPERRREDELRQELSERSRELTEKLQAAHAANEALREELLQARQQISLLLASPAPCAVSPSQAATGPPGYSPTHVSSRPLGAPGASAEPPGEPAGPDVSPTLRFSGPHADRALGDSSRRAASLTNLPSAEGRNLLAESSLGEDDLLFSRASSSTRGGRPPHDLALRRELAVRKRLNAQRRQRCVELEQQVHILTSSLDVAREKARVAESVGLSLSQQLHRQTEEARVLQHRSEEAGKLLRAAQARLEVGERFMAALRKQRGEYKALHEHHTECLEENRLLRASLERLETERLDLLEKTEKARTEFLALLAEKGRCEKRAQDAVSKLAQLQRQQEKGTQALEAHVRDLEDRLAKKEEQVRSLRGELEAAVVRAEAAEREYSRLRSGGALTASARDPKAGAVPAFASDDASTVAASEDPSKAAVQEAQLSLVLLLAEAAQASLRESVARENKLSSDVADLERQLDRALATVDAATEETEAFFADHEAAGALYIQPAYTAGETLFWTSQQLLDVLQNRANWADLARGLEQRELELEARLLYAHQQNDGLHDEFLALMEREAGEAEEEALENKELFEAESAEQSLHGASWRLRSLALDQKMEERAAFPKLLERETSRVSAAQEDNWRLERRVEELVAEGEALAAAHAERTAERDAVASELSDLKVTVRDLVNRLQTAEANARLLERERESASHVFLAPAESVSVPAPSREGESDVAAQLERLIRERDALQEMCAELAQRLEAMTNGMERQHQEWEAEREAHQRSLASRGHSADPSDERLGKENRELHARWKKALADCESLAQQKAELETRLQDLSENCAAAEAACRDLETKWKTEQTWRLAEKRERRRVGRRGGRSQDDARSSRDAPSLGSSLSSSLSLFGDEESDRPPRRASVDSPGETREANLRRELEATAEKKREAEEICKELGNQLVVLTGLLEAAATEKEELVAALRGADAVARGESEGLSDGEALAEKLRAREDEVAELGRALLVEKEAKAQLEEQLAEAKAREARQQTEEARQREEMRQAEREEEARRAEREEEARRAEIEEEARRAEIEEEARRAQIEEKARLAADLAATEAELLATREKVRECEAALAALEEDRKAAETSRVEERDAGLRREIEKEETLKMSEEEVQHLRGEVAVNREEMESLRERLDRQATTQAAHARLEEEIEELRRVVNFQEIENKKLLETVREWEEKEDEHQAAMKEFEGSYVALQREAFDARAQLHRMIRVVEEHKARRLRVLQERKRRGTGSEGQEERNETGEDGDQEAPVEETGSEATPRREETEATPRREETEATPRGVETEATPAREAAVSAEELQAAEDYEILVGRVEELEHAQAELEEQRRTLTKHLYQTTEKLQEQCRTSSELRARCEELADALEMARTSQPDEETGCVRGASGAATAGNEDCAEALQQRLAIAEQELETLRAEKARLLTLHEEALRHEQAFEAELAKARKAAEDAAEVHISEIQEFYENLQAKMEHEHAEAENALITETQKLRSEVERLEARTREDLEKAREAKGELERLHEDALRRREAAHEEALGKARQEAEAAAEMRISEMQDFYQKLQEHMTQSHAQGKSEFVARIAFLEAEVVRLESELADLRDPLAAKERAAEPGSLHLEVKELETVAGEPEARTPRAAREGEEEGCSSEGLGDAVGAFEDLAVSSLEQPSACSLSSSFSSVQEFPAELPGTPGEETLAANLRREVEQLQSQCRAFTGRVAALEKAAEDSREVLSKTEEEKRDVEERLRQTVARVKDQADRLARVAQQCSVKDQEIQEAQRRETQLCRQIEEQEEKQREQNARLLQLNEERHEALLAKNAAEQRLLLHREQLAGEERRRQSAEAHAAELLERLEAVQRKLLDCEDEKVQLALSEARRREELERLCSERERERERERQADREREEKQQRRVENLERAKQEKEERVGELLQRLEDQEEQKKTVERQQAHLRRELAEQKAKLDAREKELQEQKAGHEAARKEYAASLERQEARHQQFLHARLEEERMRAEEDVRTLQTLLQEKREEQKTMEENFRRQLERQVQAARELDASLQECENEEEEREERHRATARQLQTLVERYNAALEELTAVVGERDKLREKLAELQGEVAEIRRETRDLQAAHLEKEERERQQWEAAESLRGELEKKVERLTEEREREAKEAEAWRDRVLERETRDRDELERMQREVDAARAQEAKERARERQEWEERWREQQEAVAEKASQLQSCEERLAQVEEEARRREEASQRREEEREKEREKRVREYEGELHELHLRLHQRRIQEEERLHDIREKQREMEHELFAMQQKLQVEQRHREEAEAAAAAAARARVLCEGLLADERGAVENAREEQRALAEQVKRLEKENEEKTRLLRDQHLEFSQQLASTTEQSEAKKARVRENENALREELQSMQEQLHQEKREVAKLRKELVDTTEARADAIERQGEAEKARDEVSQQVARLHAEVDDLERSLHSVQAQLAEAQEQVEAERARGQAAEAAQARLESCLRELEAKARDERERGEAAQRAQEEALQAERERCEEEREARERSDEQRLRLLGDMERWAEEKQRMEEEVQEREAERERLEHELQGREEEICRLQEECRRRREETVGEIAATRTEQEVLRGELKRLHDRLEQGAAEVATLTKQLGDAESEKRLFQLQVDEHLQRLEQLCAEKSRAETELSHVQMQYQAERERHASQREFWEKLVNESQQRQQELRALVGARDASRQTAEAEWRGKTDSLQAALASVEEKVREREGFIASLQQQLADARDSMNRSCSAVTELQAKESRYEAKIAQLQEESGSIKRVLESALADCRRQAEEHEQMLRETLGETQNQAQSLQRQLELSRAELTGRERAWQSAEQQSREETSQLRSRCGALEAELRALETRAQGLEQENRSLQAREEATRQELEGVLQREAEMQRRFQQTWAEAHVSTEELLVQLQREEQKNRVDLRLAEQRVQEMQQVREREVMEWSRERTRLQAESEKRQRDAAELTKQLAEAQLAAALAKEEVCRAQDELAVLKVKDEALQRQFLTLASSSAGAALGPFPGGGRERGGDSVQERMEASLSSARALTERRCRALEAALKTASESRDRNAQHCASLRRELAELSREVQREKEEGEIKATELERAQRRIEKLLALQEETRAQASELHRRCREYQAKVAEMLEKQREEECGEAPCEAQRASAEGPSRRGTGDRQSPRDGDVRPSDEGASLHDSRGSALARQTVVFQKQTEMLQAVIEDLGRKLESQQEQQRLITHGHQVAGESEREAREREERLESRIRLLEQQCQDGEIEREALRAELQRAEVGCLDAQNQKEEAEKEVRRLQILSESLQRRLDKMEAEREGEASTKRSEREQEERERQLVEALQERDIQQRVQESYLERIRSAVDELKTALKQTRREKDSHAHRVLLLRQQIEEATALQRERDSAFQLLQREMEETRERHDKLETDLEAEKAKRQKVELQKEDVEATFVLDRAALEEECRALQSSLETLRGRLQVHEETKRLLEAEAKRWATQCQETQAALGEEREKGEQQEKARGEERLKLLGQLEDEREARSRLEQRVAVLEQERQREQEEREKDRERRREEVDQVKARMAESRTVWEDRCKDLNEDLVQVRSQWRETQVHLEKALRGEEEEARRRERAERERDAQARRAQTAEAALACLQAERSPGEGEGEGGRLSSRGGDEPGSSGETRNIQTASGKRGADEAGEDADLSPDRRAPALSTPRDTLLQEELSHLRKTLQTVTDSRDSLQSECLHLRQESQMSKGELDGARNRCLHLEEEMRTLSQELRDCRRALREADSEKVTQIEKLERLQSGLERTRREREETLDRVVALERELSRLQREKEESLLRLQTAEQERESLALSLAALRERERHARRDPGEDRETEGSARKAWQEEKAESLVYLETLERQLKATEASLARIREDRDRVQRARLAAEAKLAAVLESERNKARERDGEPQGASSLASSTREGRRVSAGAVAALESEVAHAQRMLEQARERTEALERELAASYKQRETDGERVSLLRAQVDAHRKTVEEAEATREKLMSRLEECSRQEAFATAALEAERKLNNRLKEQCLQMEKELEETGRRRLRSEADAAKVGARLREVENLLHKAREQFQVRSAQAERLRDELDRQEEEVLALKATRDEHQQVVESLEGQLQAAQAQLEEEEVRREKARALREKERELRETERALQETARQLEERKNAEAREKVALVREMHEAEREKRDLVTALEERDSRMEHLEAELQSTQRELAEARERSKREREMSTKEVVERTAQKDAESLRLRRDLERVDATLRAELAEREERLRTAERERAALELKKKESEEALARVQREVADLREALEDEHERLRSGAEERERAAARHHEEALRKQREAAEKVQGENESLKNALETQRSQLRALEKRSRQRDQERQGVDARISCLQQEVVRLQETHAAQVVKLREDAERLHGELEESEKRTASAQDLAVELEKRLAAADTRCRASEARVESSERALESLRRRDEQGRSQLARVRAILEGLLALPLLPPGASCSSFASRERQESEEGASASAAGGGGDSAREDDLLVLVEKLRQERRDAVGALREREEESRRRHAALAQDLEEERWQVKQLQDLLKEVEAARKEALEQETFQARELDRLRSALAKAAASSEERERAQVRLEETLAAERRRRQELGDELQRQRTAAGAHQRGREEALQLAEEWRARDQTLREKEAECVGLQEKLRRLRGEAAELREGKRSLERRGDRLSAQIRAAEEEKALLGQALAAAAKERRDLERRAQGSETRAADLQAECFDLRRQLEEVVEQQAVARSQSRAADEERQRLEETVAEIEGRAARAEEVVQRLESELEGLRGERQRLQEEIGRKDSAARDREQTVTAHEASLDRMHATDREGREKHRDPGSSAQLEQRLQRAAEERERLERALRAEVAESEKKHAGEREKLVQENLELNERVSYLQNRCGHLESDLAALQRTAESVQAALVEREKAARRDQETPQPVDLSEELESAIRARERLEREERRLKAQLDESRKALAVQERRHQDQEEALAALKSRVEEVQQTLRKREEELVVALARLTGKESELECAEKEIQDLQKAAQNVQERLDLLEETKRQLEAKNSSLQRQVDRQQRELSGLTEDIAATRGRPGEGEQSAGESREEGNEARERQRRRAREEELEEELRRLEEACKELQRDKRQQEVLLKGKTRELDEFRTSFEKEVRALQDDAARLQAMRESLEGQREDARQTVKQMEARIREANRENLLLQRALERAEEECSALKMRVEREQSAASVDSARERQRREGAGDVEARGAPGAEQEAERTQAVLLQRIESLEAKLQQAEIEEGGLKRELQGATRRAEELQHALEQGVEKFDELATRNEELKRKWAEDRRSWEARRRREVEEHQKESAQLREECMALEKENRVFQQELDRQAGDLKALHEKTLRLADRNAHLQAELATQQDAASAVAPLEKEISALQEELEMREEAARGVEADLEVYRLKNRELETEVATLWKQIAEERGEREQLESDNVMLASHQNPEQKLKYTEVLKRQLASERSARLRLQRDANRFRVEAFSLRPLLRLLAGETVGEDRWRDPGKGEGRDKKNTLQMSRAVPETSLASSLMLGASQNSAAAVLSASRRILRCSRPGLRQSRSVSVGRRAAAPAARALSLSARSEKQSVAVAVRGRVGDAFPVYRQLRVLHRSLSFVMNEFISLLALLQDVLKDEHLLERLLGILPVSSTFVVSPLPPPRGQQDLSHASRADAEDPPGLSLSQLDEERPPEMLEARRRYFFTLVCDVKQQLRGKLLTHPGQSPAALTALPALPSPSSLPPRERRRGAAEEAPRNDVSLASPLQRHRADPAVQGGSRRREQFEFPLATLEEGEADGQPGAALPASLSLSPLSETSFTLSSRENTTQRVPRESRGRGASLVSGSLSRASPRREDSENETRDDGERQSGGTAGKGRRAWDPRSSFSLSPSASPGNSRHFYDSLVDEKRAERSEPSPGRPSFLHGIAPPPRDLPSSAPERKEDDRRNLDVSKNSIAASLFSSFASVSSFFESRTGDS